MSESLKEVIIYTDGACTGNPGAGGYGAVLIYDGAHKPRGRGRNKGSPLENPVPNSIRGTAPYQHRKEISGGYKLTTNNRMEMMAAIAALKTLKTKCAVTLHSDSKYLVDAITQGWAKRWQANGWKRNKKEKAKNPDLWQELLDLCNQHKVTFVWVKGHAGIPENERCDRLAVAATQQPNLPPDSGYIG